jgi:hypothetical protein
LDVTVSVSPVHSSVALVALGFPPATKPEAAVPTFAILPLEVDIDGLDDHDVPS